MMGTHGSSIPELSAALRSEGEAYKLLEELRWPGGEPICPHCRSIRKHYFLTPRNGRARRTRTGSLSQRRVWKCAECRRQFSALTGTIFHRGKVSVRTLVLVIEEMTRDQNGASAREIEGKYALTPKTASLVVERIREAMRREPLAGLLSGQVAETGRDDGPARQLTAGDRPYQLDLEDLPRVQAGIRQTLARLRRESDAPEG